jgi:Methyltransferase domain
MLELNVQKLLRTLQDADQVLDVGGWACPFNRAQWVLDAQPFETRGFYRTFGGRPSQGGDHEWFTSDTWVQRDMCDRTPWPFADEQFDFVICSHTLEDVRDPLWVCAEMIRVGKRGYIEVPSRAFESALGIERPHQAGLSHHRWLIDIRGSEISFLHKYHLIHSHWRFALPRSYGRALSAESAVQWLWWENAFTFREVVHHGVGALECELEEYVRRTHPYPEWRLRLSELWRRVSPLPGRAAAWAKRGSAGRLTAKRA